MSRPPRGWQRLLRLVLRAPDRDAALGDLAEEMGERARRGGPDAARRWYRRQVLASLAPALAGRLEAAFARHHDEEGRMGTFADIAVRDVRYALRGLRRSPGFTAAVLLTLAVGVGSAAAVYTVVEGVVLRPLPYPDAGRLHMLYQARGENRFWVSAPNWADWRERLASFEEVAAYSPDGVNAMVEGEPERIAVAEVSGNFFRTLGVTPALGRDFSEEEAREALPVAVVSDGLWRRRMGADPGAVGASLTLDGAPVRVVGVLPPVRALPDDADVWVPLRTDAPGWRTRRGIGWLLVLGRLREGVDPAVAAAEAEAVGAALADAHPDANADMGIALPTLREVVVGDVRPGLAVLLGGALLLLVVVATNVGGLLVARAADRGDEVAIRSALGGGRRRLAAQFLVEGLVLAALGGALALGAARVGIAGLVALAPPDLPRLDEVALGGGTATFVVAATAAAALLFAILPLVHATRGPRGGGAVPGRSSRGSGPSRSRHLLVVGQVASSLVLVAGAGLLLRSFERLTRVDLGFEPEGALVAALPTVESAFGSNPERLAYLRAIQDGVAGLPGARATGLINAVPLVNGGPTFSYELREPPSDPDARLLARYRVVTPGAFAALGMRFTRGRSFTADEVEDGGPPAIVVDEAFARAHFPGRDPVGAEVGIFDAWWRIVGVVATPRDVSVGALPERHLYVPMARAPRQSMSLVVRSDGDPAALLADVRAVVRRIDPAQPLTPSGPLARWVGEARATPRFIASLLAFFGLATTLLAGVGLYGLLAFTVARRTREIGVRVALGAAAGQVRGLVVRQGLTLAAVGALVGVAAAWVGAPLLESLLFDLEPRDPAVLAGAALLLVGVSWVAAWLPATRATRVSPREALRAD